MKTLKQFGLLALIFCGAYSQAETANSNTCSGKALYTQVYGTRGYDFSTVLQMRKTVGAKAGIGIASVEDVWATAMSHDRPAPIPVDVITIRFQVKDDIRCAQLVGSQIKDYLETDLGLKDSQILIEEISPRHIQRTAGVIEVWWPPMDLSQRPLQ